MRAFQAMSSFSQQDRQRSGMVGWYNPCQLIRTGIQVALSTALGSRADSRVILSLMSNALDDQGEPWFDYTDRQEIWIDYVADLGDGWNPTYTIAYLLAQPELKLRRPDGGEYRIRRADILIMGGDEVYPAASPENYQQRLVAPYAAAFPWSEEPHPHLFALPGNHDWYDGLASFMRLFCQKVPPRWIGGWRLPQTRSYFALRLPHRWWVLGVDIQLEADIDGPQLEYFQRVAEAMRRGDRVILCTPKPDWIYGSIYDPALQSNLAYLERKIIAPRGAQVVLKLSGDLHHYRRHEHERPDGSRLHLIIAGGGGAFLHPTHGPKVDRIRYGDVCFHLKAEYPERRISRRLSWRNLLFPLWNPWFGFMTGMVYMVLNWVMPHELYRFTNITEAIWSALKELLRRPSGIVWVIVTLLAFVLFTDTHKKVYRWFGGMAHAALHLMAALVVAWIAHSVSVRLAGFPAHSLGHFLLTGFGTFLGGWLVGSEVMGLYLLISLNVFGRHSNEAFSSLRLEDYKNFLRLHVTPEGKLVIYPIGIDRIPRRWRRECQTQGSQYIPEEEIRPGLIESPLVIP